LSFSIARLVRRSPKAKPDDEGRMTLVEHLRELRSRLLKAVLALLVAMIVAWQFRDTLFNLLADPLLSAVQRINVEKGIEPTLNFPSAASALMLNLKISLVAALVAASPIWLYQLWSFIVPGLHKNERRWSLTFVGTAAPLFIGGVLVGYWVMPKGLEVLLGFTPSGDIYSNIINVEEFLSFILRVLVVFGVAFLIPIFVILLNLVGVLTTERLSKWRAPIIFVFFVFAAVATPTIDPITMLLLAIPMSVLFLISEQITRLIARRRRAAMIAQGIDIEKIERAGEKTDD
jgi:sec-independent protein translocase protein TatC